jgi:hypothetical protein
MDIEKELAMHRTFFKICLAGALALLMFLGLSGCKSEAGAGEGSSTIPDAAPAIVQPIAAQPDPAPGISPTPTPAPIAYSVFESWQDIDNKMPLDFASMHFDTDVRRGYFQCEDGMITPNQDDCIRTDSNGNEYGSEIRKCVDHIQISGANDVGTITVSGSEIVWSAISTSESINFTPCPTNVNGAYNYIVDADGLHLQRNGTITIYPEAL